MTLSQRVAVLESNCGNNAALETMSNAELEARLFDCAVRMLEQIDSGSHVVDNELDDQVRQLMIGDLFRAGWSAPKPASLKRVLELWIDLQSQRLTE